MPKKKPIRKDNKTKKKSVRPKKQKKQASRRKSAPKRKPAKIARRGAGASQVRVTEIEVVGIVENPLTSDEVDLVEEETSDEDFPPDFGGSE